jgi:hypothetical protein
MWPWAIRRSTDSRVSNPYDAGGEHDSDLARNAVNAEIHSEMRMYVPV